MFKNLRLVYITTKNRDEAHAIGKAIVERRLAACVNIIDNMESIYHWEGEVTTDRECVLLVKTPYHNVHPVTKLAKELHSYDCPSIFTLTITEQEGNEEYLMWLLKEARPPVAAFQPDD